MISATAITSSDQERQEIKHYFRNVGSYIEFQNSPNTKMVHIIYEAGYDTVPEEIKLGIIKHVAKLYKNRESNIGSYLSDIKMHISHFAIQGLYYIYRLIMGEIQGI